MPGERFRFIGDNKKSSDIEITLIDEKNKNKIIIKNHITLYRDPSKWGMYFGKVVTDFYRFEEDYNNNKFDDLKALSEKIINIQQDLISV